LTHGPEETGHAGAHTGESWAGPAVSKLVAGDSEYRLSLLTARAWFRAFEGIEQEAAAVAAGSAYSERWGALDGMGRSHTVP